MKVYFDKTVREFEGKDEKKKVKDNRSNARKRKNKRGKRGHLIRGFQYENLSFKTP